ncbi:hypothetical protein BHE74_00050639, partial [Ensete ventricosum]
SGLFLDMTLTLLKKKKKKKKKKTKKKKHFLLCISELKVEMTKQRGEGGIRSSMKGLHCSNMHSPEVPDASVQPSTQATPSTIEGEDHSFLRH